MLHRRMSLCALAVLAIGLAGCTQKAADASGVTCTYQWWVGPVGLLIGIAAVGLGWANRAGGWRAVLFLVIAALGTLTFAPFGFFDKVIVDNAHLETRWGFWCFPTTHNIRFDDVSSVQLTSETSHSRRGRRTSYHLVFQLKSGKSEKLSADNSLMQEAADDVLAQLQQRQIPVVDHTAG